MKKSGIIFLQYKSFRGRSFLTERRHSTWRRGGRKTRPCYHSNSWRTRKQIREKPQKNKRRKHEAKQPFLLRRSVINHRRCYDLQGPVDWFLSIKFDYPSSEFFASSFSPLPFLQVQNRHFMVIFFIITWINKREMSTNIVLISLGAPDS